MLADCESLQLVYKRQLKARSLLIQFDWLLALRGFVRG
jgi:hypothetical protein